jgi:hypothetical protein
VSIECHESGEENKRNKRKKQKPSDSGVCHDAPTRCTLKLTLEKDTPRAWMELFRCDETKIQFRQRAPAMHVTSFAFYSVTNTAFRRAHFPALNGDDNVMMIEARPL